MFVQKIAEIEKKLRKIFPATPLEKSEFLSEKFGANIFLKREDLSPVRSYKIRGAFHFFSEILREKKNREKILACASAGNHAQGFAFCCAHFGVRGEIFMPTTTPQQKVLRTKKFLKNFGKINFAGDVFDDSLAAAKNFCEKNDAIFVPPFDDEKIIDGDATIAAEICAQLPEKKIDFLTVPVGGGGLLSGIAKFFAAKKIKTKIFPVESAAKKILQKSLSTKKNLTEKISDNFCDGTAVQKIGKKNWAILQKFFSARDVQICAENRVAGTILNLLFYDGIILEPAGALAIDALKNLEKKIRGKNVVAIASGGNFDFEKLPETKERAANFRGTKKYFILQLPQRPGALREFLEILGPDDDIVRFEYLKKSARNFGTVLLGIETSQRENFQILFQKIGKKFKFRDITDDEILSNLIV